MNEDAVHVFVGRDASVVTRVHPQLNARHKTLADATRHAREIATRVQGVLLIQDARVDIVTRESYRAS